MSGLTDLLSMALLGIGTVFLLIGATGLLRLPDVFTRLHGASVTDTLGAGAILLGLALREGPQIASIASLGALAWVSACGLSSNVAPSSSSTGASAHLVLRAAHTERFEFKLAGLSLSASAPSPKK